MDLRLAAHRVRSMRAVDVGVTALLVVALYAVGMHSIRTGNFPALLLPLAALVLAARWPLLGTTVAAALSVGLAGSGLAGDGVAYAVETMTICSYLAVRTVPGWGAVVPGGVGVLTGLLTLSFDVSAAAAIGALVGGGAAAMQGLVSRTAETETLVARLRARTQEQERRQAWLSQRAELARELHDIVGHHVTAMVVSAEAARAQGAEEPTLHTIAELGRKALSELDTLVGSLRDDGALPTTRATPRLADLPALMEPLRAAGLSADLSTDVTGDLSESTQLVIYRIVQETTTNTLKHAHATAVRVDVVEDSGEVTVRISDNGNGSADAVGTTDRVGRGLTGIGERVQGLGGSWTYEQRPGDGTTVTAVLPVGGGV
ncbi:MAG: sensor histidine kinase [Nocardioidaceae bacterium]